MRILLSVSWFIAFIGSGYSDPSSADTLKIYYQINQSDLTADNKEKLQLILQHNSVDSVVSISIAGYTDFLGSKKWNDVLSGKRAGTVRSYLLELENKINITECVGKGELPPVLKGNILGVPENRRVEIILEKKTPTKTTGSANSLENIDQIKPGENIILRNLNFEGGRHILLPGSVPELDKLFDVLNRHPSMVIAIQGYVCCTDSLHDGADFDTQDQHLSLNRAKAIFELLVEKGISPSRLSYSGFGGKRPLIFPERTEYDREQNRRVEIKVIKL